MYKQPSQAEYVTVVSVHSKYNNARLRQNQGEMPICPVRGTNQS